MIETTNDVKEQIWRDLIIAANNSGMSKREWLKENNIKKSSFYRWQKIIQENEIRKLNIVNDEQGCTVEYAKETEQLVPTESDITFIDLPCINDEGYSSTPGPANEAFRTEVAVRCGKYVAYLGNEISDKMLVRVLRAMTDA